jgi:hypothetical protein
MRHHSLLAVFSLLSIVTVGSTACSSSSSDSPGPTDGGGDGGGDTATGPTADQACTDVAKALCEKIASCSPLYIAIGYGDVENCKSLVKPSCLSGLTAPSTGTTPQRSEECVTAATAASCSDLFANRFPASCQPVAGKLADGAACIDDSQCTSKYCSTGDGAVCGKCGAAPAAGASCATQHCATGTQCVSGTCVVAAKSGEACSAKAPCEYGLSCTDGKCGPFASNEGDACDLNGAGKPMCDLIGKGLFCLPTTNKCVKVAINDVGGECGYNATTSVVSVCKEGNGVCQKVKATDLAGKCIAPAKEGAACNLDEAVGPKCQQTLTCIAGKCLKADAATCK